MSVRHLCTLCGREFKSPQSLGLHLWHARRVGSHLPPMATYPPDWTVEDCRSKGIQLCSSCPEFECCDNTNGNGVHVLQKRLRDAAEKQGLLQNQLAHAISRETALTADLELARKERRDDLGTIISQVNRLAKARRLMVDLIDWAMDTKDYTGVPGHEPVDECQCGYCAAARWLKETR